MSRRRGGGPKASSVLESRIMVEEVKVGTEASTLHDSAENNTKNTCNNSSSSTMNNADIQVDNNMPKPSNFEVNGKRKSSSAEGNPLQITRRRSELGKNLDEQCKELSVSSDRIKKTPVQIKKTRSVLSRKGSGDQASVRNEINLVRLRKVKSDSTKAMNDSKSEPRRMNSEPSKNLDQLPDGNSENSLSLQLVKAETLVPRKIIDEHVKESDDKRVVDEFEEDLEEEPVGGAEDSPVGFKESRSDEDCEESRAITGNVGSEGEIQIVTAPPSVDHVDGGEEEEVEKEIEVEVEERSIDIRDMNINVQEQEPEKLVVEEKKPLPSNERSVPISRIVKKRTPAVNQASIHPSPTKTKTNHFHGTPSRLQSFTDLIMWRDVSRSAFIFGIGAFVIISSSYTKDLNISFISVLSYLGLLYLGVSFIFRSFISRGSIDMDITEQEYVVGEDEAVWLIKLVLPYVNEFLSKLRNLFSGDPATTLKLAVLLFVLARCGGSITIWKMTKLGFFGVFMVPKLCCSYSSQLVAYGTFWIRRFGDAWKSCSHKKAVGFGIFTLVWNLSSVVARIWALFILFVAFKYYQQWWIRHEEVQAEEANITANPYSQYTGGRQVQGRRSTIREIKTPKKGC